MSADHWAAQLAGKPWAKGAAGPDAFSCWGLLRYCMAEVYGKPIPEIDEVDETSIRSIFRAFRTSEHWDGWHQVDKPADGDAVLMSHGLHPHHIGIWLDIDGGGVLHAVEKIGVLFSSPAGLKRNGWQVLGYWRHE